MGPNWLNLSLNLSIDGPREQYEKNFTAQVSKSTVLLTCIDMMFHGMYNRDVINKRSTQCGLWTGKNKRGGKKKQEKGIYPNICLIILIAFVSSSSASSSEYLLFTGFFWDRCTWEVACDVLCLTTLFTWKFHAKRKREKRQTFHWEEKTMYQKMTIYLIISV